MQPTEGSWAVSLGGTKHPLSDHDDRRQTSQMLRLTDGSSLELKGKFVCLRGEYYDNTHGNQDLAKHSCQPAMLCSQCRPKTHIRTGIRCFEYRQDAVVLVRHKDMRCTYLEFWPCSITELDLQ